MKKLHDLRNYETQKYLLMACMILLAGAMFIGMTIQDAISSSKPPIDFNEMNSSQCKAGVHVTGDVQGTIGYYWESYDTVNGMKQESSVKRIYLIPYGTEGKYIGLNVRKYDFERFDALENATYEFFENQIYPEPLIGYEGYIKKCDKRMQSALEEAYVMMGGTGDVNEMFVSYYIEQSSSSSVVMVIIGLVLLAVSAVVFVIFFVKRRNEKENVGNSTYIGRVIFDRNDYIVKASQTSGMDAGSGDDTEEVVKKTMLQLKAEE